MSVGSLSLFLLRCIRHAISVGLYPRLAYKPDVDFKPIGLTLETPLLIVARKDFAPRNLEEFIAYVKANSEKLNMGHAGVGSILYSFGLMLNSVLGVRPTLVPFNGGGPATSALLGGQIDYTCGAITDVAPHVHAGALKAYAIAADERSSVLLNVPTTKEAGLPEFKAMPWFALFAPRGTPRPILDKLSDALDKALDDQKVRGRFSDLGGYVPDKRDEDSKRSRHWSKTKSLAGPPSSKRRTLVDKGHGEPARGKKSRAQHECCAHSDIRFGSSTDVAGCPTNVCFTPPMCRGVRRGRDPDC
jgi:tripartite-type tricarboxylate transporter receptor subunit TctC